MWEGEWKICTLTHHRILIVWFFFQDTAFQMQFKDWRVILCLSCVDWWLGPVSHRPPSWMKGKEVGDARLIYVFAATEIIIQVLSMEGQVYQCSWSFIHIGTWNNTYKGPDYLSGTLWGSLRIYLIQSAISVRNILLAPFSSRGSRGLENLGNLFKVMANELQNLYLRSYRPHAICCCPCAMLLWGIVRFYEVFSSSQLPPASLNCPGFSQNSSDSTFLPTASFSLLSWNLGYLCLPHGGFSLLVTSSSIKNDLWNKVLERLREKGMQSQNPLAPRILSPSERSWNKCRNVIGKCEEISVSWLPFSLGN